MAPGPGHGDPSATGSAADDAAGAVGSALETAVVEPEARAVLSAYESTVSHHAVVISVAGG